MQLYIKTEAPAQDEKTMHWPSSIADDAKWQMTNHKSTRLSIGETTIADRTTRLLVMLQYHTNMTRIYSENKGHQVHLHVYIKDVK